MKFNKLMFLTGILTFTSIGTQTLGVDYNCPDLTSPIECKPSTVHGWICHSRDENWVAHIRSDTKPVFNSFITAEIVKEDRFPLQCKYTTDVGDTFMHTTAYRSDASPCSFIVKDGKNVGFTCPN